MQNFPKPALWVLVFVLLCSLSGTVSAGNTTFGWPKCLSLDGGGYASRADHAALAVGVGSFALGGWLQIPAGQDGTRYIVNKRLGGTTAGYALRSSADGLRFIISNSDDSDVAEAVASGFNDGTWKYFLAVRNGTDLTLYVNGLVSGTDTSSGVLDLDNARTFYLGCYDNQGLNLIGRYALIEFLYFGTLPADVAAYALWRHNNPLAALSQYANGAWVGYDDADRSELVTNGGFDADTDWTKGVGWTIAGGVASHAAGTGSPIYQSASITSGQAYEFIFAVSNRTAGGIGPVVGGQGGTTRFGNGTYREVIVCGSVNTNIVLSCNVPFDGDIDDVSVKRIGRVARWPLSGQYYDLDDNGDAGPNALDLTAQGTGNKWLGSTIRTSRMTGTAKVKIK